MVQVGTISWCLRIFQVSHLPVWWKSITGTYSVTLTQCGSNETFCCGGKAFIFSRVILMEESVFKISWLPFNCAVQRISGKKQFLIFSSLAVYCLRKSPRIHWLISNKSFSLNQFILVFHIVTTMLLTLNLYLPIQVVLRAGHKKMPWSLF